MQLPHGGETECRLPGGMGDDDENASSCNDGDCSGDGLRGESERRPGVSAYRNNRRRRSSFLGCRLNRGRGFPTIRPSPLDAHRAEQQARLRNNDRQKRLVADTEKLLALATDLKTQVDKSTKDTLSVDVIKKADEIEKLAHSVKERMKG